MALGYCFVVMVRRNPDPTTHIWTKGSEVIKGKELHLQRAKNAEKKKNSRCKVQVRFRGLLRRESELTCTSTPSRFPLAPSHLADVSQFSQFLGASQS